jgi:tRNA(fMet)-specific endonuclease VapC
VKYLLDSNVIIALVMNRNVGVVARAAECFAGEMVTSAIAYGEVLYGARRGKPPAEEQLSAFVEEVAVLPFDCKAAQTYANLPFRRHSYDRLIAAHALSLDLVLVTDNERHFSDIDALRVEKWFADR